MNQTTSANHDLQNKSLNHEDDLDYNTKITTLTTTGKSNYVRHILQNLKSVEYRILIAKINRFTSRLLKSILLMLSPPKISQSKFHLEPEISQQKYSVDVQEMIQPALKKFLPQRVMPPFNSYYSDRNNIISFGLCLALFLIPIIQIGIVQFMLSLFLIPIKSIGLMYIIAGS